MGPRRKFSAEYKRGAEAMLHVSGVTMNQIAVELGIFERQYLGAGDTEVSPRQRPTIRQRSASLGGLIAMWQVGRKSIVPQSCWHIG